MRWRWWRPDPDPGRHRSWPDHGRDASGRLYDGHTVRIDGGYRWADLLPGDPPEAAGRSALTEPTVMLDRPLMTLGQQRRGDGGRRQPGSSRG